MLLLGRGLYALALARLLRAHWPRARVILATSDERDFAGASRAVHKCVYGFPRADEGGGSGWAAAVLALRWAVSRSAHSADAAWLRWLGALHNGALGVFSLLMWLAVIAGAISHALVRSMFGQLLYFKNFSNCHAWHMCPCC